MGSFLQILQFHPDWSCSQGGPKIGMIQKIGWLGSFNNSFVLGKSGEINQKVFSISYLQANKIKIGRFVFSKFYEL